MNISLFNIIDYFLLPVATMVVGKFLGLILTAGLLGTSIDFSLSVNGILRPVVDFQYLSTLSTYSDLFMFSFVAVGFSIVLFRALHFHDSHISPSVLIRLSEVGLFGLVSSSIQLYHEAVAWTVVLWGSTILVFVNVFSGSSEGWIAFVCLAITVFLTVSIIRDVQQEIEISRVTKNTPAES